MVKGIKGRLWYLENRRRIKLVSVSFLILFIFFIGMFVLPRAFAQPVNKVELVSDGVNYEKKEPGAWKVNKSAKWIDKGVAEITFDVDTILKTERKYTDVLLVLDISSSMEGEKINKVKADSTELIERLLSNKENRLGLITFDSTSEIVSDFTNDKNSLVSRVNSLSTQGATNYYQALINVDTVLKNYVKEKDRECVVLFLTDGYPCEEIPNEVGQYNYLQSQYSYMIFNAVQYEMGSTPTEAIKNISDNQFIADMKTLNNILFKASVAPTAYDIFEINDYIDTEYFYVEGSKDIKNSRGIVMLDNTTQKVTWKIEDFRTGSKEKMTITIKLKDEFIGQGGVYPTNKSVEIKSKLGEVEENTTSNKTPVLLDNYEVIYDGNVPTGSKVVGVPEEKSVTVFDVVGISDKVPTCEGYQFKGWEIVTKNIKKVNDDYFVMPEENVIIKAKWSKLKVTKSMEGTINEKHTLYKQVKKDYENTNGAKLYNGANDTFNGNQKVYYYYGKTLNNNVIFGDFCWKMIRTTDTGGVKMVYNGEPDSEGGCGNDRGNHVGYDSINSEYLGGNYLYGTDYTYDNVSKKFTLSGDTEIVRWNDITGPNLIGKYTCKNTTGSCSILYYVSEYDDSRYAYVLPINSTTYYSQIGKGKFNLKYNSPADVGYMYNKRYDSSENSMVSNVSILNGMSLSTRNYYADEIEWNPITKSYSLVNPYKVSFSDDYKDLVGKYTFSSSNQQYTSSDVYYIARVEGSNMIYFELSDGQDFATANMSYIFSDSLIKVDDDKYVLDSSTKKTIKRVDWFTNYVECKGKYYQDPSGDIYSIIETGNAGFIYVNVTNNYKYGNSFIYNEETKEYTLSGEMQQFYDWPNNYSKLNNTHYTCWNTSGTCKTISYIHYTTDEDAYYINLENGMSIDKALEEMLLANDVNKTSSALKNVIDFWYSENMIQYTDYLEDTVWCNDRSVSSLGGWNPNGGSTRNYLYFKSHENFNNLTCINRNDRFTVDSKNGNGSLTYPVGLVTSQEQDLSFQSSDNCPLNFGKMNWTFSPNYFYSLLANGYRSYGNGAIGNVNISYIDGIHPAVSLRSGIEYLEGDGTVEHPYIVDMDSEVMGEKTTDLVSKVKINNYYGN